MAGQISEDGRFLWITSPEPQCHHTNQRIPSIVLAEKWSTSITLRRWNSCSCQQRLCCPQRLSVIYEYLTVYKCDEWPLLTSIYSWLSGATVPGRMMRQQVVCTGEHWSAKPDPSCSNRPPQRGESHWPDTRHQDSVSLTGIEGKRSQHEAYEEVFCAFWKQIVILTCWSSVTPPCCHTRRAWIKPPVFIWDTNWGYWRSWRKPSILWKTDSGAWSRVTWSWCTRCSPYCRTRSRGYSQNSSDPFS